MGWAAMLGRELRRLRHALYHRITVSGATEAAIVDAFHRLYYDAHLFGRTWSDTRWLGVQTAKCPLDLWVYQEMLVELRPDVIIECGTAHGGSALFLASMCDLLGHGRVVSVDVRAEAGRPAHSRITYVLGSSVAPDVVARVKTAVGAAATVMVVLDSDHRKGHVLEELRIYGELVTPGSYLVVEDTNLNGHPVSPEFGPGPAEAVRDFVAGNDRFRVDQTREKFYLTFNPGGYLRRVR